MERKEYSAGAVKMSFWFVEFRKVVHLLDEGKSMDEVKQLALNKNLFAAPTILRANQIFSTVSGRIKALDESFIPVFMTGDLATQKLVALIAAMAYDTLFFDFVYEVIREKLMLGSNELKDSDVRVFFKDKQQQNEKVAAWTDATLVRLGRCYPPYDVRARQGSSGCATQRRRVPDGDPSLFENRGFPAEKHLYPAGQV